MKKILLLVPLVAVLAACGTTDVYQKRADAERQYQERAIDKALDERPKWMTKLPLSSSAIFASGEGHADSYSMAVHAAKTDAMAHVCYSADGKVTSQTKDFATGSSKTSSIERATRTNCNGVDITGIEFASDKDVGENPKVIRTGTQFTAFVLLALPTGDANVLRKYKDDVKRQEREVARSNEAFKELPPNQ